MGREVVGEAFIIPGDKGRGKGDKRMSMDVIKISIPFNQQGLLNNTCTS